jgi:hypothetical protein
VRAQHRRYGRQSRSEMVIAIVTHGRFTHTR